ncbi:MAG: B12-binding domain-containing radical SAM protein [Bacteroidetes bacterium]|nr:B12-binding domain-containing radical SAM protein [Bacteroidota bacterium]MBL6942901.1 B12-binding domain-containing radical SAM protein [Bacteroidales bacterium]
MTEKKHKKLLLINPFNQSKRDELFDLRSISPPLGLGLIAGLTPDNWDIEIIDENFEPFQYKEADLVGITALTSAAYRAYEIADIYRKKGIKTVLGGIHISMRADEAEQYADAIVIGEAEAVWHQLLKDFEDKKLKKRYVGELKELKNSVHPRRDLFHPDYSYANIQTTRGCPMSCDFCSVHTFNGSKYRERPVEEVLDEIETIKDERLFFVDDNIIGYTSSSANRAIRLFKGMIERGIKKDWYCQASLNIADNEEALVYAAESGCRMILIGIESEKVDQLKETNKKMNIKIGVDHYEEAFQNIHKHGISVLGALVFGLDSDSLEDIKNRTKFAIESGMDAMQATIVTPLPGTSLFKRLENEGRLLYTNFPKDWEHYHFLEVSHKPIKMTPHELADAMQECWTDLWNKKTVYKKMLMTLKQTKNVKAAAWAFASNTERHNTAFGKQKSSWDIDKILGMNYS